MIQGGTLYYSTKIHAPQKPIIRINVCAKTYKFILQCGIAVGVSHHKCMFIQLSITHNKQLVNVFWQLLPALRESHHQANTQEETKQKLCISFGWHLRVFIVRHIVKIVKTCKDLSRYET